MVGMASRWLTFTAFFLTAGGHARAWRMVSREEFLRSARKQPLKLFALG